MGSDSTKFRKDINFNNMNFSLLRGMWRWLISKATLAKREGGKNNQKNAKMFQLRADKNFGEAISDERIYQTTRWLLRTCSRA